MSTNRLLHALSVFAAWLFLAVPFLLVLGDWASTRERARMQLSESLDQQSKSLVQQIQVSGSAEFQVIQKLTDFHRLLRTELARTDGKSSASLTAELYQKYLGESLPPHHLSISIKEKSHPLLVTAFENSTASGANHLGSFAALMDEQPCSDEQYDEVANHLFAMTGFPLNSRGIPEIQRTIRGKDEGIMMPFTSKSRCSWIYWFYPYAEDRRILVSAIFDLAAVPVDYPFLALTETYNSAGQGIAFLPLGKAERPFWSGFFADKPGLRNFLKASSPNLPLTSAQNSFADYNIISAPLLVGDPGLVVLVSPQLKRLAFSGGEVCFLVGLVLLFVTISFVFLQRRIFCRGWRISIGLVLLTAIFSVFYLPAGIGRLVVQFSIDGYLAEMKKTAETNLERNMQTLEDRFHLTMADFFHRLHHLEKYPGIMEDVKNGELREALNKIYEDVQTKYPLKMGNSLVFSPMQNVAGKSDLYIKTQSDLGLEEMFAPLFQAIMVKFRADFARPGNSSEAGLSLTDVKNEMVTDFLVQFFQGVLGRELYHNLMANPVDLIEVRSTFVMVATSIIPIRFDGVVEALLLAIWSEYQEEEEYLDFLINRKSERPENFDFMALRKSAFQNFARQTATMVPEAWSLAEKARRVGIQLTSKELLASDNLLIKSRPGESLGFYILTGVTSLKSIFLQQTRLEEGFNKAVGIGLILLLFLVVFVYRFFMSPLRQLQTGLENIKGGDFQARLPIDGRNDEFGRINASFNAMAKGLEEGSLLGKFVSSAVINVVRNKEAFTRALAGEKRQMTILFASIRLDKECDAEQTFDRLAFNLKTCQDALRGTSGIIDKVMEEKILVFFDHEACGGQAAAVHTCLDAVASMRARLLANGCSGYFGLATGSVIAGVLGARNIRLDYTVIGDAVNLSARLNAMAKGEGTATVIADENTRKLVPAGLQSASLGNLQIKGKVEPVAVFRLG